MEELASVFSGMFWGGGVRARAHTKGECANTAPYWLKLYNPEGGSRRAAALERKTCAPSLRGRHCPVTCESHNPSVITSLHGSRAELKIRRHVGPTPR